MGGTEAFIPAGDSEDSEAEPANTESPEATTESGAESTETTTHSNEGPRPLKDYEKRNMTRSHAERISRRLRQLSDDETAAGLASTIDTAYEKSVEAENSHNASNIESATQNLRNALLSGRAHLDATGHTERTGADQYAERELGLDEEQPEVLAARKRAEDASKNAEKRAKELKEEYADLGEDVLKEIREQTTPIFEAAVALVDQGKFDEAVDKYNEYVTTLEGALVNRRAEAEDVEEKEQTPELQANNAKKDAEKALSEYQANGNLEASEKEEVVDMGQQLINAGDAAMRIGNYEEALTKYGQAKAHFEQANRTANAAVEVESETIDRGKLLGDLASELSTALRDNPPARAWVAGSAPQNLTQRMQEAYNRIADTDDKKMALAGSYVSRGVLINTRGGEKQLLSVSAVLTRSGNVQLRADVARRFGRNEEVPEGLVANVDAITPAEEGGAIEKTPGTMKKELDGMINQAIDKFKGESGAFASDLQAGMNRMLRDYVAQLTPEERENLGTFSRNGKFRSTTGLRMNYEWYVTINEDEIDVQVD